MTVNLTDAAKFAMSSRLEQNSCDPRVSISLINVLIVLQAAVDDAVKERIETGEDVG